MALSFRSQATIRAPAEAAWALLTDGAGWPRWNKTVDRVEGAISPGGVVKVYVNSLPYEPVPLTVTAFEPPKRMVWTGGMPLGLFRGQRTFTLEPAGEGQLRVAVEEIFTGLVLPLFRRSIPDLVPMFDAITGGLKAELER
ncbi:MAG: SRPBCC domain-containing protein [Deltaproteobacteria bacterium]|nr:SRPBCC domain-containing protein [Deltaproteobacteria bacterium]